MICTTVREGNECFFMGPKGCKYTDGSCLEAIDKCEGCNRRIEYNSRWYCSISPDPASKWKLGNCNMATHIVVEQAKAKAKINPLKASKRSKKK